MSRKVFLADLQVTYREHEIPEACPHCKADLCANDAIRSGEYSLDVADITIRADGSWDSDYDWEYGAGDNFIPHDLYCKACGGALAAGSYAEEGRPHHGGPVAQPMRHVRPWGEVYLYLDNQACLSFDGARSATNRARLVAALSAYRETGNLVGASFRGPNDSPATPDSYSGPSVADIDWTGFPPATDPTPTKESP